MFDFAIIGSGAAGATLAKELSTDAKVAVLEKGEHYPKYVIEGNFVDIAYLNSIGGSTVCAVGNALRVKIKGIKIEDEIYEEIERELNVKRPPYEFLREYAKKFLNLGFERTPKYINFDKCNKCGKCAHKPCNAKWTAAEFIKESKADVICGFEVKNIRKEGDVFYIDGVDKNTNSLRTIKAKNVIISAGGINSPRILSKILDNEHIGKNLFVDTFITVGGILKDTYLNKDVQMIVYKKYRDFILASHYSELLYSRINEYEKTRKEDVIGIMIKIKDENVGEVGEDYVSKPMTKKDTQILSEGVGEASKILHEFGVERIYSTIPRGSHPGGTCAIKKVVDENLETEIEGLYVCDASVFPEAPGAPPILAIIGIAKKLARYLKNEKMGN
ncbi:GMC oxidoreductase [Methanotorris igneus]|uniref:FAD dependent oxidoreductase n=1 Tax=Methanotorris igneus (strain DSM 5666 / JCM 11834 / Kol 5) TaxID=880724 RepID=F6BCK4_METIK|nr:GMC oxidoreductase [Methanotorris igneus]AEF96215.1 FAD dependent oxidoreductase [Methanotorris igneus Kol 5]